MTTTTTAVPPAVSSAPFPFADTTTNPGDLHIDALVRELKASWHPLSPVGDRRREHRIPCDLPATLVPLDTDGQIPTGSSQKVRIKDFSQHGVGIGHGEPMPDRLVLLSFSTNGGEAVRLVVRLKWCRFKRTSGYESGGQLVRILKPEDGLYAHAAPPEANA